jgi:hypothetical protein
MDTRKYASLMAVVQEHLAGRDENARDLLGSLVDGQLRPGRPEDLRYYIFASALSRRLQSGKTAEINLYLRQYEQTQIALFNLLAEHLPTVAMAGPLANEVLSRFVGGHDEVTLLDVGIGSGRQEVALVHLLAGRGTLPRKLNVIAVEPDAGSLIEAGTALQDAADALGFELEFHPVHKVAEELDEADWAHFASFHATPLVVLGAFAVHHVRPGPERRTRDELFHRLRALEPDAVVLCEPSSNHDSADLMERFQAAWHHFGLTFGLIDGLGVDEGQKAAMKMFFAREIDDILANAEEARCERHEPVDAWVRRMRDAGFTPYPELEAFQGREAGGVRVRARDGYLGLDHGDETLVAIVCATSGVPAAAGRFSPELVGEAH